jgi:magnesium chelatase family protein
MDFANIKGQAHIKRAMEIAAAGDHRLAIIVTDAYNDAQLIMRPAFFALAEYDPYILTSCPCGHWGSDIYPCFCTLEQQQKHVIRTFPSAIYMCVYMGLPKPSELLSEDIPEDTATVKKRVKQVKSRSQKPNLTITPQCKDLLNRAVKQLALQQSELEFFVKVACTIADLANETVIQPEHLVEAFKYRNKIKESK